MKTYLKIVPNDWKNASRDKRELSVAAELGYQVMVIAKGERNDKYKKDLVDGYIVYRFSTRPLKIPERFNSLNRVITAILWAKYIRTYNADIISCHDLIALFIGYMSIIFMPSTKKPLLIYDSHEFEIARNTKRSKLQKKLIKRLEGFLIKKVALVIMVNDTIAEKVKEIYRLDKKPLVIRNIPNYWTLDEDEIKSCRNDLMSHLNISKSGLIIMYHGLICKGNGIDISIKALSHTENTGLVILGYTHTPEYIIYLKKLIKEYNVGDRCIFHDAVPIDILYKYVGAADIGMLTFEAITQSYYYTLPNKFFENIQALTPMICSDFPELKKLIDKYEIGFLCNSNDEKQIANLINLLKSDRTIIENFKKNLLLAKDELNWENERELLIDALKHIEKG